MDSQQFGAMEVEKQWVTVFNRLPLFFRVKCKDVNDALINVTHDIATNLGYVLGMVMANKELNPIELEMDVVLMDWFSDLRKLVLKFKEQVKGHFEELSRNYCKSNLQAVSDLFTFKKSQITKQFWGIEDKRDIRKKMEDVLHTILHPSVKQDILLSERNVDFKVCVN